MTPRYVICDTYITADGMSPLSYLVIDTTRPIKSEMLVGLMPRDNGYVHFRPARPSAAAWNVTVVLCDEVRRLVAR